MTVTGIKHKKLLLAQVYSEDSSIRIKRKLGFSFCGRNIRVDRVFQK